jgi:aldose 1-epimerase
LDAIEIADERTRLVVGRQGASILRFDAFRPCEPPLALMKPAEGPLAFGCQLLVPWSNRVSGGGFEFGGHFHPVEPNVAGEPFPLHGDGFQKRWRLVRKDAVEAELRLDEGAIGPYRYAAAVGYALKEGTLEARLSVENRAAMPLPYGLGFHPWFPRRPQTQLQARARRVWLEDTRHLPAGVVPVASRPECDFSRKSVLPKGWINNAFDGWDGRASIVQPEDGIAITLDASPSLGLFLVYSPSAASGFFCFEPVSHPVDAHHGEGLTPLRPGDTMTASMRLSWTAFPAHQGAPRR